MPDNNFLESIAKSLYEAIPSGLHDLEQNLENKFKDILQIAFAKLDLVSREEFDTQVKVLSRTRAKVTELEKQVESLVKMTQQEDQHK